MCRCQTSEGFRNKLLRGFCLPTNECLGARGWEAGWASTIFHTREVLSCGVTFYLHFQAGVIMRTSCLANFLVNNRCTALRKLKLLEQMFFNTWLLNSIPAKSKSKYHCSVPLIHPQSWNSGREGHPGQSREKTATHWAHCSNNQPGNSKPSPHSQHPICCPNFHWMVSLELHNQDI